MTNKTEIIKIDGVEYEIKRVEAKRLFTEDQFEFIMSLPRYASDLFHGYEFNRRLMELHVVNQWQNYLISEARKRGFISGCTIKTATDMDKMKSGRLKLIGLSKLATDGRKQIIIYDGGKWIAEAIPEVKKHWFKSDTWSVGELLTRDEMEKIKCEPEKYNNDEIRSIIIELTNEINMKGHLYASVLISQAKLIREILNDYLK